MAYISRYSPRIGTKSYAMPDDISNEEKAQREYILTKILKQTALKNNEKFIGKTVKVLVERLCPRRKTLTEEQKTRNCYIGENAQFINVKTFLPIPNNNTTFNMNSLIGDFVEVKITKTKSFSMEGKIIKKAI